MDIDKAIVLATTAHMGQVDKAGEPYILHPLRVGASLHRRGPHYVMAGILHDVVEDTPITLEDIAELGAPPEVVDAISAVTKHESERTWEAYKQSLARAVSDPIGGWVKAADVWDNYTRLDRSNLPQETYKRLRKKYLKAFDFLARADFDPNRHAA